MMYDAIVTWEKRRTILSQTCAATNERIPGFTKAWRKCESYYIRDMVNDQYSWYSDKGYEFLVLKGERGITAGTLDPGPY